MALLLMFDGIVFMIMAAMFFVMSRSLSPSHWTRFFTALGLLLLVDSVWIGISILRGINLWPWIILNLILGALLVTIYSIFRNWTPGDRALGNGPTLWCALATIGTTIADYFWMREFYFS